MLASTHCPGVITIYVQQMLLNGGSVERRFSLATLLLGRPLSASWSFVLGKTDLCDVLPYFFLVEWDNDENHERRKFKR